MNIDNHSIQLHTYFLSNHIHNKNIKNKHFINNSTKLYISKFIEEKTKDVTEHKTEQKTETKPESKIEHKPEIKIEKNINNDIIIDKNAYYRYLLSLNIVERIKKLNSLRILKEFNETHNYSNSVYLLENKIVKKNLKNNNLGNSLFLNEINALIKLQNNKHFPKLLAYNIKQMSIYMSYCGEKISKKNLPNDWEFQINEIYNILQKVNVNSNDMIIRNTCVLDDIIYIIDFGLYNKFSNPLNHNIYKLKEEIKKLK